MTLLSKLQIRSLVLSVISKFDKKLLNDEKKINEFIDELSVIEDKSAIADIILKEYPILTEPECAFCAYVLKRLVPMDYVIEKILSYVKLKSITDNLRLKYFELLSLLDAKTRLAEASSYFENPNEVVDIETKKLLERAIFNPEAMLDFLDFISNVSDEDASLLLNSLNEDYSGNSLANVIYPILYSDFSDSIKLKVIDILSETKSSLGIKPLNYLLKVSDNEKIVKEANLALKKIKFSGGSEIKADEYYNSIIKDYLPVDFYATIPDGSSCQAFLITRVDENGNYLFWAVVINDNFGVMDSFGFYNVSQSEVVKILAKFYKAEGKYKVPNEYVKSRIESAILKTINLKSTFPYEFICWLPLINDINSLDISIEKYCDEYSQIVNLSKEEVLHILTKDYTLRWFITPSENSAIKNIIEYIYSLENPTISDINNYSKAKIKEVFDENTLMLWKIKLLNLVYILKNNNNPSDADIFYTILSKVEYFNLFKDIIIQRSLFSYFIQLRESIKDKKMTLNIFKNKNSDETKYDIKKIQTIIDIMRINWIDG